MQNSKSGGEGSDFTPFLGDRYAIGRRGWRLFVALPQNKAQFVSRLLGRLEVIAIVLFIVSAMLFLLNQTDQKIPVALGATVIGFRAAILLATALVIVQTNQIRRQTGTSPELDSDSRFFSIDGVRGEVHISGKKIELDFHNQSMYDAQITTQVDCQGGSIEIPKNARSFRLPTSNNYLNRVTPRQARHRLEFQFENVNTETTGSDNLSISVRCVLENAGQNHGDEVITENLIIPFSISNIGEVVSDEIVYKEVYS